MLILPGKSASWSAAAAFDWGTLFASSEIGAVWDPADFATKMWQDAGKASQVTAAGQSIGYVEASYGQFDLQLENTAPILVESGGLYGIDFSGGNQRLQTTADISTGTSTMAFAASIEPDAAGYIIIGTDNNNVYALAADSNTSVADNGMGTPTYRIDGTDLVSPDRGDINTAIGTNTPVTAIVENMDWLTTEPLTLGYSFNGVLQFNGTLWGPILFREALSTAERDAIEAAYAAQHA